MPPVRSCQLVYTLPRCHFSSYSAENIHLWPYRLLHFIKRSGWFYHCGCLDHQNTATRAGRPYLPVLFAVLNVWHRRSVTDGKYRLHAPPHRSMPTVWLGWFQRQYNIARASTALHRLTTYCAQRAYLCLPTSQRGTWTAFTKQRFNGRWFGVVAITTPPPPPDAHPTTCLPACLPTAAPYIPFTAHTYGRALLPTPPGYFCFHIRVPYPPAGALPTAYGTARTRQRRQTGTLDGLRRLPSKRTLLFPDIRFNDSDASYRYAL